MAGPEILHVSADFPDTVEPFKTGAIKALVDSSQGDFHHEVVSLNRRSPGWLMLGKSILRGRGKPRLDITAHGFEYGKEVLYEAPARGIFHATMLHQLGDMLAGELTPDQRPDLLLGHKLTVEGIVVRRMSEKLGLPYGLCIQGDTDLKILRARPDLAGEFARILHGASILFPFTPWALRDVEDRLGKFAGPVRLLPCITGVEESQPPREPGDGLVSVFHLKNWRRKNLRGIVEAFAHVEKTHPGTQLEIIGGGDDADRAICEKIIGDRVGISLAGPMAHDELFARLNKATAFVLPSYRESFGMVFIEALYSGIPVIYPRGAAIDGYLDGKSFAIPVDARQPQDIARGIEHALKQETALKAELAEWQASDDAFRFRARAIASEFTEGLREAIRSPQKVRMG